MVRVTLFTSNYGSFISLASLVYIYAQVAETKHLSLDDDGHDEYDCKLSQENDTIEKESLLSP